MVNQRLQRVYEQLREIIEQGEGESVNDLLKGRSRDDFLTIFTCANIRKKCQDGVEYAVPPLSYALDFAVPPLSYRLDFNEREEITEEVLLIVKEQGILKKVLTSANIRKKCPDGVEYDITPLGYTLDSNNWKEKAGVLLGAAKEEGILKKVLTSANICKKYPDSTKYMKYIIPFTYALDFNDWKEKAGVLLGAAKKEGILKEVLICANTYATPIVYALGFNDGGERTKAILDAAKEEGILKEVLTSMVESDYERLKRSLWVTENHDSLNEIYKIEKSMAIDIAMKVGGASSIIAGLIAFGGCFAAGVQLPILALVGIAVAAALAVGIVAGGITYAVLKPSNKLDGPDLKQSSECCSDSIIVYAL